MYRETNSQRVELMELRKDHGKNVEKCLIIA